MHKTQFCMALMHRHRIQTICHLNCIPCWSIRIWTICHFACPVELYVIWTICHFASPAELLEFEQYVTLHPLLSYWNLNNMSLGMPCWAIGIWTICHFAPPAELNNMSLCTPCWAIGIWTICHFAPPAELLHSEQSAWKFIRFGCSIMYNPWAFLYPSEM